MSEQFAMQPEEFESTSEKLDSILDRLNSLGASVAEMKEAPLRPLQSVPDLVPEVEVAEYVEPELEPVVPEVEVAEYVEPVDFEETQPEDEAHFSADIEAEYAEPDYEEPALTTEAETSLTPPAVPELSLVPPME